MLDMFSAFTQKRKLNMNTRQCGVTITNLKVPDGKIGENSNNTTDLIYVQFNICGKTW